MPIAASAMSHSTPPCSPPIGFQCRGPASKSITARPCSAARRSKPMSLAIGGGSLSPDIMRSANSSMVDDPFLLDPSFRRLDSQHRFGPNLSSCWLSPWPGVNCEREQRRSHAADRQQPEDPMESIEQLRRLGAPQQGNYKRHAQDCAELPYGLVDGTADREPAGREPVHGGAAQRRQREPDAGACEKQRGEPESP